MPRSVLVDGRAEEFVPFHDGPDDNLTSGDAGQYAELERRAKVIRSYEPTLVPGPLQVRGYAQAVAGSVFPEHSDAARKNFVELRMERPQVLNRGKDAPTFDVVLGEAVLHTEFGSADVRREQLTVLLDEITGGRPNVSVGILPSSGGEPFVLMDFADAASVVCLEGKSGSTYRQTDAAVKDYSAKFARLRKAALGRDEAAARIREIIKSIR